MLPASACSKVSYQQVDFHFHLELPNDAPRFGLGSGISIYFICSFSMFFMLHIFTFAVSRFHTLVIQSYLQQLSLLPSIMTAYILILTRYILSFGQQFSSISIHHCVKHHAAELFNVPCWYGQLLLRLLLLHTLPALFACHAQFVPCMCFCSCSACRADMGVHIGRGGFSGLVFLLLLQKVWLR